MKETTLTTMLLLIFLISCDSNDPMELSVQQSSNSTVNPYRVTIDEALDIANNMLQSVEGSETRGSQRQVGSIEILGSKATRNLNCVDTLLYLVNYKDEQGFALLSADLRYAPIFAISETGHLNLADTTYNPGLAIFLRQTEESMASSPFPFNPGDSIGFNPGIGLRPTTPVVEINVSPTLLHQNVVRWTQSSPFNYYTPFMVDSDGERKRTPVGCVPLATAMILSYYKWPQSIDTGESLNWNNMINESSVYSYSYYNNYSLFGLLEYLGRPELYDVSYALNGSSAAIEQRHKIVFTKMKYLPSGDFMSFVPSSAVQTLKSNATRKNPILVWGTSGNSAHAWVIDGCIIKKGNYGALTPDNPTGQITEYFFRCVWGWGGQNNGYFRWNQSATLGGEMYDNDGSTIVGEMGDTSSPDGIYRKKYYGNLRYRNEFFPNN